MSKREQYLKIAESILAEAGVQHVVYVDRAIRGYASRELWDERRRYIVCSVPTTPNRLLTLAHEAGHIYFRHTHQGKLPKHRTEYEAENYSYATMRRYNIPFDEKKHVLAGKLYVFRKIRMGFPQLKRICQESYEWVGKQIFMSGHKGAEILHAVKSGRIQLHDFRRPDPTLAPKPRVKCREITFYEVGKQWNGRKSTLGSRKGNTKRCIVLEEPGRCRESKKEKKQVGSTGSFAEILRNTIDGTGLSIYRIAKDTEIPQQVLSRFHNGTRDNLRLDVAEVLARYLGLTLEHSDRTSFKK